MIPPQTSLVSILRWRAKHQPDTLAYRYLVDGEYDEVLLTYAALDLRARSIGALLQSVVKSGDRALILLPPGLDFIAAYFGCLYAKVIAVPAYPPHPARIAHMLPAILGIAADATPTIALVSSSLFDVIASENALKPAFANITLLAADREETYLLPAQWQEPDIHKNDIAFLQYTSGSTSAPKGVMVSHGNLIHNLGLQATCFGPTEKTHSVIWLPPYHDMGLIGGILQPVFSGYPVTLMPHMMFLQRPLRWLQAISRFRATLSGAPNFAYDLCTRKIKPEQRALLDLSRWDVTFNGAEQVHNKTQDDFADYFAPCGFHREAFLPCYGLAEATLIVSGGPKNRTPVKLYVNNAELEHNRAIETNVQNDDTRTLMSCGQNLSGQQIRIVNLETHVTCLPDEVGEIWVGGASVAKGYWNNPSATEQTFAARIAHTGEGPFLRTGDLGFMHEGELYITGRLKNLIIIDGNNHYSNDIEITVEKAHPAIRPGGAAAFSINKDAGESLVIIAELEHLPCTKEDEIKMAIRKAIAFRHDLQTADIKLTPAGTIPRTTSGKKRHFLCKKNYLTGNLKEV